MVAIYKCFGRQAHLFRTRAEVYWSHKAQKLSLLRFKAQFYSISEHCDLAKAKSRNASWSASATVYIKCKPKYRISNSIGARPPNFAETVSPKKQPRIFAQLCPLQNPRFFTKLEAVETVGINPAALLNFAPLSPFRLPKMSRKKFILRSVGCLVPWC